jgi:hypothetical protein
MQILLGPAKPAKIFTSIPEVIELEIPQSPAFSFLYWRALRIAVITSIVYPYFPARVGYCLLVPSPRR